MTIFIGRETKTDIFPTKIDEKKIGQVSVFINNSSFRIKKPFNNNDDDEHDHHNHNHRPGLLLMTFGPFGVVMLRLVYFVLMHLLVVLLLPVALPFLVEACCEYVTGV